MSKFVLSVLFLVCLRPFASAQDDDIFEMSLEELMNVEITSVSKRTQRLQDVTSSVYVITSDKIQSSGAVTVGELLREFVPGFWAASLDFNRYDSYLRGTNTASFLVLLDGTPMNDLISAGMLWNNFEIPLSTIDRIEVVKGSGGVIYGANSATGVISIFTTSQGDPGIQLDLSATLPGQVITDLQYGIEAQKASVGLYGRFRHFVGYDQLKVTEDPTSLVPRALGEGDTLITNLFTEDDNTYTAWAAGISIDVKPTDKLTLASDLHVNASYRDIYVVDYDQATSALLFDGIGTQVFSDSRPFLANDDNLRLVGNLKGELELAKNHQLFLRASFNKENAHHGANGGFNTRNSMLDFEIQDYLELGPHGLSFGANYRILNYDINEIAYSEQIDFIDKQNTEFLNGFFLQDHINLFNGLLGLDLGAKAENFSLINDKYYLSPMAKFSLKLSDQLTLWGGYSRSYTTPGYNLTNIELTIVSIPTPDGFSQLIPAIAAQAVIDQAGVPADQIPDFFASPEGQAALSTATQLVEAQIIGTFPNFYNTGGVNGASTTPTSFSNLELGARFQATEELFLESNFFYTQVSDDVINTPNTADTIPSPTRSDQSLAATFYGNYIQGTNIGIESIITYRLNNSLTFEGSYSFFVDDREFQENDDFDLALFRNDLLDVDDLPGLPQHIARARLSFQNMSGWAASLSGLYASGFYNRFGTIIPEYQYERQRFDPLFGDAGRKAVLTKQKNRFILNFKIAKSFSDHFSANLFGNDILKAPFVESANQFITSYPRQVGRMIGLGLTYNM